ncbi:hypothetical protein Daus18300_008746 [Diaporthe australafricana]|uniref:MYB DNA-binding domain-containing protein n=1 Tax=Diaporthe australafricana TaxID=127596 RepID=A0ABR3WHB9_9PEZI
MPPHTTESPAKKQSKWSPEEDALIIELRGSGMKWEDISKRLPGRSAISCRLHYQNYLERRSEWDEERKNKLARLYERFKPEMWAKVAEEMQVPWRAAEAMHWQLGEADMARRAGVVPFSLTSVNMQQDNTRQSPTRGHMHSHSQGSMPRSDPHLLGRYTHRGGTPHLAQQQPHHHQHPPPPLPLTIPPPVPTIPPPGSARGPLPPRRESLPPRQPPGDPYDHVHSAPGPGLAPIQTPGGRERSGTGTMHLPSVAELTTGVSPYSTPAYSLGRTSASPSATASPRQSVLQGSPLGYGESSSIGGGGPATPGSGKRGRSSPDAGREAIRRRH